MESLRKHKGGVKMGKAVTSLLRVMAVTFTFVFALAMASTSHDAQASADKLAIGMIKSVTGDAFIIRGDNNIAAKIGTELYQSDMIKTGDNGSVGISFKDNSIMSAGPSSILSLEQFAFDSASMEGHFLADVKAGTLSVVSGDMVKHRPGSMEIKTPTAILGVRGTEFVVKVD